MIISEFAPFSKNLVVKNNDISVFIVKNLYLILVKFFLVYNETKCISNIVYSST